MMENTVAASKNTNYVNSIANGWGSLEANIIPRDIVTSPIDLFTWGNKEINCATSSETYTETHRWDSKLV